MSDLQFKVTACDGGATHITILRDGKPLNTVSVPEYERGELGIEGPVVADPLEAVLRAHAAEDPEYARGLTLEGGGRRVRITDGRNVLETIGIQELKRKRDEPFAGNLTYGDIVKNTRMAQAEPEDDAGPSGLEGVRRAIRDRSSVAMAVAVGVIGLAGGTVVLRTCSGAGHAPISMELNSSPRSIRFHTGQHIETVRMLDGHFETYLRKKPKAARRMVERLQKYVRLAKGVELDGQQKKDFAYIRDKTAEWAAAINDKGR